ncbi:hypothetical protein SK128_017695 [Halocaridina rubra]|uniref:Uncharacterized protein n=1 Tax=Halocaridina rubra TaxID=373956 RepID=A0AAN8X4Q5_HALRR
MQSTPTVKMVMPLINEVTQGYIFPERFKDFGVGRDENENKSISRTKRLASDGFPSGTRIKVNTILTVPVPAISTKSMVMDNVLFFDLPSGGSAGRSYRDRKSDRFHVYARMEEFLNDLGYNGHECTLRTLCEIAEAPFEHGLYGEIINLVLSASVTPDENEVYDEYMTAEYYGKNYGNCASIYTNCPNSVLNVISNAF